MTRGSIHPLDHPMFWPWLLHESLAFLNYGDFLQNIYCSFWFWLILNTPFNFLRLLIPDHTVSINIRRKNVWNLLLTTLVYGSIWEHLQETKVSACSLQSFSGFLVGFWTNPWNLAPHGQAAAEELDVQEREMQAVCRRCRNGRGLMDVDGVEDIVGHNNWVCLKVGDRTHPKSIGIQQ